MILAYDDLHVSVPGQIIVVVAIPKSTTCRVVAPFGLIDYYVVRMFLCINGLLEHKLTQFLLTYRYLGL